MPTLCNSFNKIVGLYQESPPGFHYLTSRNLGLLLAGLEPATSQLFSSAAFKGIQSCALPTELQELVQRAGFEPTKRNGMQYEYLKYLLVAISARHPQFRHTTKPANRNSPLTTRTTLLNVPLFNVPEQGQRPPAGIEPATTRSRVVRSTTELRRLVPTPGIEPGTRSYTRSRDA